MYHLLMLGAARSIAALMLFAFGCAAFDAALWRSPGTLKICKEDEPEDYGEPPRASGRPCTMAKCWGDEVVVPAGAIFHDVGPIDNASGPWIKWRVMTLAVVSIKGKEKCKIVPAAIPDDNPNWGTSQIGPVITKVGPKDRRLLEIESLGARSQSAREVVPEEGCCLRRSNHRERVQSEALVSSTRPS